MKSVVKRNNFKVKGLVSLNVLIAFMLLFSSTTFAQSSKNCPSCDKEQARYDTVNMAYKKVKTEIASIDKKIAKASEGEKTDKLKTLQSKLESLNKDLNSIQQKRQEAITALDNCLSVENPAECKKCENGKEVNDDGAFCDDGDPCTKNDRCVNGICIGDPVTSNENPDCGGNGE